MVAEPRSPRRCAEPVVAEPVVDEPVIAVAERGAIAGLDVIQPTTEDVVQSSEPWSPRCPQSSHRRCRGGVRTRGHRSTRAVVPSLVIDDADPDSAERELEDRAARRSRRRSFLPPILLDREDRSARQGGLTLAVIILLIAATLTLSYLMRRPSSSGDGVTHAELPVDVDHLGSR